MNTEQLRIFTEDRPSQRLAYMRRTGPYGPENNMLMEQFKEWVEDIGLFNENAVILGIALDNGETTPPRDCRYDVCLIVEDDFETEDSRVRIRTIEGGKYVVMEIPHTAEAVQKAWTEGLGMLMAKGYNFDLGRPIMEAYPKEKIEQNLCQLWVPIE